MEGSSNVSIQAKQNYRPFLVAGIVIAIIYALVLLGAHLTGTLALTENAKIVELNTCMHEGIYEPTRTAYYDIETIYICGIVEGTTSLHAAFYLINERPGHRAKTTTARVWPGTFFVPIALGAGLPPGNYHIQAYKNQLVIIETPLEVTHDCLYCERRANLRDMILTLK